MTNNNSIFMVNNSKLENLETVFPSLVIDTNVFADALNRVLLSRYIDETTVKYQTAIDTIKTTEEKIGKSIDKTSEEYTALLTRLDRAESNKSKFSDLLEQLRKVELPENPETSLELDEIVTFYSMLYSTCGGIDVDKNKIRPIVLKGMRALYNQCVAYADKYEDTEDSWTNTRKQDFLAIRESLNQIGSRLNGDPSEIRKGFKYSCGNKDLFRLISFCAKINDHERKTGKFVSKRNSFERFQKMVICTIFRIDSDLLVGTGEIEI